jgi:hypothetical protein
LFTVREQPPTESMTRSAAFVFLNSLAGRYVNIHKQPELLNDAGKALSKERWIVSITEKQEANTVIASGSADSFTEAVRKAKIEFERGSVRNS